MNKEIIVHLRNGYGYESTREFNNAEEYLDWRNSSDPINWDKQQDVWMEITKITTRFLPLDWTKVFLKGAN